MNLWLRSAAIAVGTIVVIVGVFTAVDFLGRGSDTPTLEVDTVSTDWNDAVRQLNIEPIYPPQEDIYVGDIYATITRGDRNFQGKSIKLWHVDLSDAVKRAYSDVPVFPKTLAPPEKDGQMWDQAPSDGLFDTGQRKSLSLVAFPRFVVRHSRQAAGGASANQGLFGWASGLIGSTSSSDELEELYFPGAETYGINSIEASAALLLFCETEQNKPICAETGVRQMLSMVVGDEIWKKELDDKKKPTGRYAMGVELILVNQVFLTRSIVRTHSLDNGKSLVANIAAKVKELSEPSPPPNPNAAAPAGDQQSEAKKSALERQQEQAARLKITLEELRRAGVGANLSASAADGSNIALNQTFPRPIVVGVRAVRRVPASTPDPAGSK